MHKFQTWHTYSRPLTKYKACIITKKDLCHIVIDFMDKMAKNLSTFETTRPLQGFKLTVLDSEQLQLFTKDRSVPHNTIQYNTILLFNVSV